MCFLFPPSPILHVSVQPWKWGGSCRPQAACPGVHRSGAEQCDLHSSSCRVLMSPTCCLLSGCILKEHLFSWSL